MPAAKRIRTRKRNPEKSSPAQAISSNDDLLLEILFRLPVKSLLRFKSVSKQWLSLISDTQFIHRKSLKSKSLSLLALNEGYGQLRYDVVRLQGRAPLTSLTFAHYLLHDGMAVISSCNGLLLCGTSLAVDTSYIIYCICNPTTRQFRIIPSPPGQSDRNVRVMGLCLAFEPSKSHRYRVVCIQRLERTYNLFQFVIYSSETWGWSDPGAPFSLPPRAYFHHAAYCHGAIHWICDGASVCIDLDKELAREIPLPPPPCDSKVKAREIAYFGESGGHLHLVQVFDFSTKQFPIYEMERDCSGWFVKFVVELRPAILSRSNFHSQLLHLARGEKEEDSFLVMHVRGKVFRYYFSSKTRQAIYSTLSGRKLIQCDLNDQTERIIGRTTSKIESYFSYRHIHQYIESLSLV